MKVAAHLTRKGRLVAPKRERERPRSTKPVLDDPIDLLTGCITEGDPVGDLEADHRAEVERDARRYRRR